MIKNLFTPPEDDKSQGAKKMFAKRDMEMLGFTSKNTVDGRNPTPPGMFLKPYK